MKKHFIFLTLITPLLFGCGQNTEKNKVIVKFISESKILLEQSFEKGTTPFYTGGTPTKASVEDGNYITEYKFTGWNPTLSPVFSDSEFTAVFESSRSYNFNKFKSNHSSSGLIGFMNSNGSSSSAYTEINGTYAYYSCKTYTFYNNSSIEYFSDYNLWRVVIRNGSDLGMTTFRFQSFNSSNTGMLMSVNGRTFTTTISVNSNTLESDSPYSFVNTGIYQLNIFSCEKAGVILAY